MKETKIICDVKGCSNIGEYIADVCWGWVVMEDDYSNIYKKMEKPLEPKKADLCEEHWKDWSIATIKIMKMDEEEK